MTIMTFTGNNFKPLFSKISPASFIVVKVQ